MWHETCKRKGRLDASVCNNKQRWNNDECRCECKELIDKGICDKRLIWNSSNCECECDKSWDVGKYLDYKNCKCSENVDRNEMIYNGTLNVIPLNDYRKICNPYTVYIVLLVMFLIVSIGISSVSIYVYWHLKRRYTETVIY